VIAPVVWLVALSATRFVVDLVDWRKLLGAGVAVNGPVHA
jgi:hypothetical protein